MKKVVCLVSFWCVFLQLHGQPDILWQRSLGGSAGDFAKSIFQTNDGSFFLTARTISINGDVSNNHGVYDFWVVKIAPDGNLLWEKTLGGSNDENPFHTILPTDEGLVMAGYTRSNDGHVSGHHGGADLWIIKLDANGNLLWQKAIGGSLDETAYTIRQTLDGGYILAGTTQSNDGNISDNHGDWDAWVVKLDANGNLQWNKTYGGTAYDHASFIEQLSDGSFVFCGTTRSNDGDVSGNHGGDDIWMVRLDANGNIIWKKCFGGSWTDGAHSFILTSDGNFAFAGFTFSPNGGDISGHHGSGDMWVAKVNSNGNLLWQSCLGGSSDEIARQIMETPDGDYILCGDTYSNDGDVSGMHGTYDAWIVKLSANGQIQWQRALGGSKEETLNDLWLTTDGAYVAAGFTNSSNGNVSGHHGSADVWVVKLSASGQLEWQKCLGGSANDLFNSLIQTSDEGFALCNTVDSNDGDVSGNHGLLDVWVVRLDGSMVPYHEVRKDHNSIIISPNPSKYKINISSETLYLLEDVQLNDTRGRTLWRSDRITLPATIDIHGLAAGIYLLKGNHSSGEISATFMVQH
jgi:Secretion system C-terminal sorting domain